MKIIKIILISLAGILVTVLLVALFIPNEFTVSVSTTINKPKQEVFDYVKQIKNQKNYSVWVMKDPNAKMEYKGEDGTVGFISSWDSEDGDVGKGEQEITKIVDGERVDVDLRFKKPFESNEKAATLVKSISETQTQVTSEFYGHNSYPMNIMSIFMKGMLSDAMEQNMKILKDILEKK